MHLTHIPQRPTLHLVGLTTDLACVADCRCSIHRLLRFIAINKPCIIYVHWPLHIDDGTSGILQNRGYYLNNPLLFAVRHIPLDHIEYPYLCVKYSVLLKNMQIY
jgi:hypothetical protein